MRTYKDRIIRRTIGRRVFHMIGWSPDHKMASNTADGYHKHNELARVIKMSYKGRVGYGVFVVEWADRSAPGHPYHRKGGK